MSLAARYDGHTEWYDETCSGSHPPEEELAFLKQALGTGGGEAALTVLAALAGGPSRP